ncbi:hypothetical protein [Acinetobacter sp. ASP199]|uniref:hypothetical protein n=1 Tax=Acinetobacter sp. ASP199 TaxID=2773709 RepID=UPI001F60106E|nr:hypothetical protein [Acinetobacter sp. ASP199]UNT57932.1 hypothetical protein IHE35_07175 [Acinetobacter sp. ASP199]
MQQSRLYIKKFNTDFSPPENITSFYKNIFEVVAITHDKTKGGYTRQSSSNLKQDKLELIFERFCFECYKIDKTSFERNEIIAILEIALNRLCITSCSGSQILDDFCDYLCLIVRDGINFTFIHRSIYEYYVALFFSKLSTENAERVIPKINELNILNFLKILNKYYFNKYFLIIKLNYFIAKYNNSIKTYELKQKVPENFIHLFFLGDRDKIYLNKDIFEDLRNQGYLLDLLRKLLLQVDSVYQCSN